MCGCAVGVTANWQINDLKFLILETYSHLTDIASTQLLEIQRIWRYPIENLSHFLPSAKILRVYLFCLFKFSVSISTNNWDLIKIRRIYW